MIVDRQQSATEARTELPADPADDRSGRDFKVAPLSGRHVYLRPLMPEDYGFVRIHELSGELAIRWRFRGSVGSPEQWSQGVWQSILAQLVIVDRKERAPVGLACAYRPSFQDGHAYLGVTTLQQAPRSPLTVLGAALFIDYTFTCWNFHKLYLEMPEYNLDQVSSSLGRILQVEGRLKDHIWYGGRRWDYITLALYRDRWRTDAARLVSVASERGVDAARIRLPVTEG